MTSPLRIYLIEDNEIVREALLNIFNGLLAAEVVGWSETEAEAMEWMSAHPGCWDAAVVDLFLRSGSGLGVLQANPARLAGQRMVVLSNYATPKIRRQCLAAGADAVFDKSNEIEEFTQFVADMGDGAEPDSGVHQKH